MAKHFSIQVFGKVQGVFFRASTQERAHELNIHGFVRNERDGSVYIEAEGEEHALQQFIQWCQHGPRQARVERCLVREGDLRGFENFNITRG
ncbi:MAG: acylphosphatase [Bacteroidota bacterium]